MEVSSWSKRRLTATALEETLRKADKSALRHRQQQRCRQQRTRRSCEDVRAERVIFFFVCTKPTLKGLRSNLSSENPVYMPHLTSPRLWPLRNAICALLRANDRVVRCLLLHIYSKISSSEVTCEVLRVKDTVVPATLEDLPSRNSIESSVPS
jgi:hypothetical protein